MDGTADDTSVAELQERLVTFNGQLETIELLLTSDPKNEELLGIAGDLKEVIKLTTDMLAHKQPQDAAHASPFPVGSIVEAQIQSVWCPAVVEDIAADIGVHIMGSNQKHRVTANALRAIDANGLPPVDASTVEVGFACQAKYYADNKYYPGKITSLTEHGCVILFEGYGNSEEVPFAYLTPLPEPKATTKPQDKADDNKLIAIPAHLAILPTDSEAEKERKRKRIKAIKSLNRQKSIEAERNTKKNDWAKFTQKQGKKRVLGAMSSIKKTSIFASPATVDGRVGVIGSDQKMTQFDDTRKKFKLHKE
ncbi:hypothetical protein SDRG_08390 [Saprolegnia diclina VS20]|uniref:Survival of motor neuron-related-splicing factor 30 n=1 Tax=Saprolegnia diclina (strain VS20) TaxID=1156394 RepID=T0RP22_SAPDV|nr:hypothetical protein SDRG_08390 [Saprolegnia diclina VS20]EQC34183.1 hypothetical protein SDRG_08390 [Saprolegnia diclina VS20]|eukprot:XP_008612495.1 hypothetical protein SDRG_08390 [Saprolegnia diclina VS20]